VPVKFSYTERIRDLFQFIGYHADFLSANEARVERYLFGVLDYLKTRPF
jgi:hypothetical protein